MIKTSTLFLCTFLFSSMAFAENHYIPLLYNLSTMFDFNPVKGAVKSLDTDVEENGKITYKISIRLNKKVVRMIAGMDFQAIRILDQAFVIVQMHHIASDDIVVTQPVNSQQLLHSVHCRFRYRDGYFCPFPPCIASAQPLITAVAVCVSK
jgi:hypothetical protein